MTDNLWRIAMREDMTEDSWGNLVSGMNTAKDKTFWTAWNPETQLHLLELTDLFNFDGIARRIVSALPEETFREGYTLHATTPEKTAWLHRETDFRMVDQVFQEADTWARTYGGSVVSFAPCDGRRADEPLDPYSIKSIGRLEVFDRRYVWPYKWYETDGIPDMLRPMVYQISPLAGKPRMVHESRLIVFRGALTDQSTKIRNNSWDLSALDAPIEAVKAFWEAFGASRTMLQEASVGVVKIRGLLAGLSGPNKAILEKRLSLMDTAKSLVNSLVLEAGDGNSAPESFERVAISLAGTPDLLDRFANLLAAVTGIPVTRLMGMAPAGLNATGDSDMRQWFDSVRSYQRRTIQPKLLRFYDLLCRTKGWDNEHITIEFNKLWQETPKEEADRRKTVADADAIYLDRQVVSPERVAANRFGKVYSAEMVEPEPTGHAPAAADLAAYQATLAMAKGNTPTPKAAEPAPPAPAAPAPPNPPGASER